MSHLLPLIPIVHPTHGQAFADQDCIAEREKQGWKRVEKAEKPKVEKAEKPKP